MWSDILSMQQFAKKQWNDIGWGVLASVVLHLSFACLLLVQLSAGLPRPPEEQSIKVELVSPSPPKPVEKAQSLPKQAFESAAAQSEQKVTEPQLPAAGHEGLQEPSPPPESSRPAHPNAETIPREAPSQITGHDQITQGPSDPAPPEVGTTARFDETKPQQTAKPAEARPKQRSRELDRARDIFSPKSMFDPRVMQALGNLPRTGRIRQLCNIEALEQIRKQRPGSFPDILVPPVPSGGIVTNDTMNAKGAAFRSRSNWYNVDFKCQVDADATKVVSFRFAVLGAVPRNEWRARRLPLD
jgi:hypothetical protein